MVGRKIGVIAHSGHKGEESPRFFIVDDVKVEVATIIRSWIEEPLQARERKRFFKVRGGDGFTYTLYYDEMLSEWFLAG
jgi:hypothetical protein